MVEFCSFLLTAVKTNLSNIIIPIISERFHQAMLQGFESLPLKSPTLRFLFTDSTLNCDISSLNIKWIFFHTTINNNTSWETRIKLSVCSCILHFTLKSTFHASSLSLGKSVLVCKIKVYLQKVLARQTLFSNNKTIEKGKKVICIEKFFENQLCKPNVIHHSLSFGHLSKKLWKNEGSRKMGRSSCSDLTCRKSVLKKFVTLSVFKVFSCERCLAFKSRFL